MKSKPVDLSSIVMLFMLCVSFLIEARPSASRSDLETFLITVVPTNNAQEKKEDSETVLARFPSLSGYRNLNEAASNKPFVQQPNLPVRDYIQLGNVLPSFETLLSYFPELESFLGRDVMDILERSLQAINKCIKKSSNDKTIQTSNVVLSKIQKNIAKDLQNNPRNFFSSLKVVNDRDLIGVANNFFQNISTDLLTGKLSDDIIDHTQGVINQIAAYSGINLLDNNPLKETSHSSVDSKPMVLDSILIEGNIVLDCTQRFVDRKFFNELRQFMKDSDQNLMNKTKENKNDLELPSFADHDTDQSQDYQNSDSKTNDDGGSHIGETMPLGEVDNYASKKGKKKLFQHFHF